MGYLCLILKKKSEKGQIILHNTVRGKQMIAAREKRCNHGNIKHILNYSQLIINITSQRIWKFLPFIQPVGNNFNSFSQKDQLECRNIGGMNIN